jgi:hypothetical protein
MIKLTLTLLTLLYLQTSFAYVIPEPLKALLKGKSEHTYLGDDCEMRVSQDNQGFHIQAYEREGNGDININNKYGRFTLNDYHELYDFWIYPYGFEATSWYYSDLGSSFDKKSILEVEKFGDGMSKVEIRFKRNNGLFYYTHYHFKCELKL